MNESEQSILDASKEVGLEEVIRVCFMLGKSSAQILPDEDTLRTNNIYTIGDGTAISTSLWHCLELRMLLDDVRNVPQIQRPVLKTVVYSTTIVNVLTSVLAWEWRRQDKRPDAVPILSEDVLNHRYFDTYKKSITSAIGYNVEHGPGVSRLQYGMCERDCSKCPIAIPFGMTEDMYKVAERVRCPMYTSRLVLLYDPIGSLVDPTSTISSFCMISLMDSQERLFEAIVRDTYFNRRLDTIKDIMTQFSPINEDRISMFGLITAIGMGWTDLQAKGPTAPWRGVIDKL